MAFVLDASAALPWCFRDEATAASERLLLRATSQERIYVPGHWPAEMLNAVTRAARRGRLDDGSVSEFLDAVPYYNIVVDQRPIQEQWNGARTFVTQYRLSAYDALYLALAKLFHVPLATFDSQLRRAAEAESVPLET